MFINNIYDLYHLYHLIELYILLLKFDERFPKTSSTNIKSISFMNEVVILEIEV